ncbi:MAG: hypothetical protein LWY06_09450 [Firmicutes bacterium]|nr:hypothetical protein [Bacillota bacterium]
MFVFSFYRITVADTNGIFLSDAAHLFNAESHYNSLLKMDFQSFMLVRELYPNLFHQAAALITLATRDVLVSTAILNGICIILIIWGAYFLGNLLWENGSGLAAAVLVPAFAGISHFLFVNNIDAALGVFVVWSFYFLVKSRGFSDRKNSICFWLVFSLGMLVKWAMLFYMLIPLGMVVVGVFRECGKKSEIGSNMSKPLFPVFMILTFVVYFSLAFYIGTMGKDEMGYPPADAFWVLFLIVAAAGVMIFSVIMWLSRNKQDSAVNFIGGLILSLALTAHYYLYSFRFLINTYTGRFWGGPELKKHASQHNFEYFFVKSFVYDFTGIIVFILLIAGITAFLLMKKKPAGGWLILAGFVSAMVLLALQPIYDTRYFLPLSGTLAVLCALPFGFLKNTSVKGAAIGILALFSIVCVTGKVWMPGGNALISGTYTDEPIENLTIVRKAISSVKDDMKLEGDGAAKLVVFYDDSGKSVFKPLVLMYYLGDGLKPDDKIYLFPEGTDLRKGVSGVPLMYYIARESDDDDSSAGNKNPDGDDGDRNDASHDAGWESLNPGTIYLVEFSDREPEAGLPDPVRQSLKSDWIRGAENRQKILKNINNSEGVFICKWKFNSHRGTEGPLE